MNLPSLFAFAFSNYEFSRPQVDSDFLSSGSTNFLSYIMIVIAVCLGTSEMKEESAINCWAKPSWIYTGWAQYGSSHCFTEGLYVGLLNGTLNERELTTHKIIYYQWMPFLFIIMAVLLRVPEYLWKRAIACSSFSINSFFSYNYRASNEAYLQTIQIFYNEYCSPPRHSSVLLGNNLILEKLWTYTLHKKWVSLIFIFSQLFQIFCSALTLLILCNFVAENENDPFGIKVIMSWWNGTPYNNDHVFPQLADCMFHVRYASMETATYMRPEKMVCELPLYTYLETLFVFIWIFMIILLSMNVYNFMKWICILIFSKYYVKKWVLSVLSDMDVKFPLLKQQFVKRLSLDGRLLLLMQYFEMPSTTADSILRIVFSNFALNEMNREKDNLQATTSQP